MQIHFFYVTKPTQDMFFVNGLKMIAVILSGGIGTRLWPLSRSSHPKQFLSLFNSINSFFQDTVARAHSLGIDHSIVICNEANRFIISESLNDIQIGGNNTQIILEPIGRNTCPAITAASFLAMQNQQNPAILVLPSDHIIKDIKAFERAVSQAKELAEEGLLVTFGIEPTNPNTEYGYIELGENINNASYYIKGFKEKPNLNTATQFIQTNRYLWNSGMFMFKASNFLAELEINNSVLLKNAKNAVKEAEQDSGFIYLNKHHFSKCQNISIDYAVIEKTNAAAVVKLDADWCDVGSWASLWEVSAKDTNGNAIKGDVVIENSKNNYFYSEDKLIAAVGVDNLIVVDTKDALLVADKSTGNIRKIVSRLKADNRQETEIHRMVYRPWGYFDTICRGERDLVKRITVKPGGKLSRQMHHHRAEHWVIVKGTAKITKGNEIIMLYENQSLYIPIGVTHTLENPGKIPLEIIEVQTGSYLGEDDIVRFEDLYGRA